MKENEKKALLAKIAAVRNGAKGLTNSLDNLTQALNKTHDLEFVAIGSTVNLLSTYVNQIEKAAQDITEAVNAKPTQD